MYFQIRGTNVRLLGSMHMFPASITNLPVWANEAYEWAEQLILEAHAPAMLPLFRTTSGTDLKQALEPEAWSALESIWPKEGPLSPLNEIHPWAALLLAPSFCIQASPGVEPRFTQWSTEESKPVQFLETASQLAELMLEIPIDEITAGLRLLISDTTQPQLLLSAMYAAWIANDLASVYSVASKSPTFSLPRLRTSILEKRNIQWAPVVQNTLKSGEKTLVVVGALHLSGPNNLIELLGDLVEPI